MTTITPQFIFPPLCCRCSKNPAKHSWLIISPNSGAALRPNKRKSYMVEVPICNICKVELKNAQKTREISSGIVSGGSTLLGVLSWLMFGQNITEWWVGGFVGLTFGLTITVLVTWPLIDKKTNSEICGVVRDGQALVFANQNYQKLFDALNQKATLNS